MDQELLNQAHARFWTGFLERVKSSKTPLEFQVDPNRSEILAASLPIPGLSLVFIKQMDSILCEIRCNGGIHWEPWKTLWWSGSRISEVCGFHVGAGLSCKMSWIGFRIQVKGYRALIDTTWPVAYDVMIEKMTRFLDAVWSVAD